MRNRLTVALVAVLGLAFSATASAQSCTTAGCSVSTTASVTIPTLQKLTLSATTTALGVPTIDNVDSVANPVATAGPSVTGKANVPFSVTIASGAANFTAPAGVTKVAGDLSWSLTSGGTYTGLSTTGANVIHQTSTGGTTTVSIFYHAAWHSTDAPGAYSLAVVYTLTEP
jgi:hypothetical protein